VAADRYFEKAGLHPAMKSEYVVKAIRWMRAGKPPTP